MVNLVEKLKNCPKGTTLYCTILGNVVLKEVRADENLDYPITICSYKESKDDIENNYLDECGRLYCNVGETILFPSETNRDWNTFEPPCKQECTIKPFDKVLVRNGWEDPWETTLFGRKIDQEEEIYQFMCMCETFKECIPYNEETKHLNGKCDEAPEKYVIW